MQHKKLAEGSAYEEVPTSVMYSENDISNSIKNGILYLEDPINHVRSPAGQGRAGQGRVVRAPGSQSSLVCSRSGIHTTSF